MPKHLTYEMIEQSTNIQEWMSQFPENDRGIVSDFLHRLEFVDHNEFSEWFNSTINSLGLSGATAIYAVRKIPDSDGPYFNDKGFASKRPAGSQGSEDTISGLISQITKKRRDIFDHPNLGVLKENKIKEIILVDDSIGSGDRISGFVNSMLANKTMMSWWSLGCIRFHILSFMRVHESRNHILATIRGSDHHERKFKKREKIIFHDHITPYKTEIHNFWGERFEAFLHLLKSSKVKYPQGYKEALSNLIFFHSVPNTLPGFLWQNSKKNTPLFPWERHFPPWLALLFNNEHSRKIEKAHIQLLCEIKRGIRSVKSLSSTLGRSTEYIVQLKKALTEFGLLTDNSRLTNAGFTEIKKQRIVADISYNYDIYVPQKRCTDREAIQPLQAELPLEADSTESLKKDFADGEFGQNSLEKTDAKTATPSFSVMPQQPSKSRVCHDTNGHKGQKDQ
jgi:hypothetical protein